MQEKFLQDIINFLFLFFFPPFDGVDVFPHSLANERFLALRWIHAFEFTAKFGDKYADCDSLIWYTGLFPSTTEDREGRKRTVDEERNSCLIKNRRLAATGLTVPARAIFLLLPRLVKNCFYISMIYVAMIINGISI